MILLLIAIALDRWIGDPDWFWRRVRHPVVGFGWVIDRFDQWRQNAASTHENRDDRASVELAFGFALLFALLVVAVLAELLVARVAAFNWVLGAAIEVIVCAVFIAQKSLADHVERVRDGLQTSLEEGRASVAMIVGRDVSQLDDSGVSKAAIESLAENFSDGVVAPILWYAIAGLPGIMFYKAVNTADSMIGHRSPKYEYFGKPAAKLDDLLNWPAARLSALLVLMIAWTKEGRAAARSIMAIVRRDAPKHRSPNAGWPEAAFAAYLGLSLGGPRRYDEEIVQAESLNENGRQLVSTVDINSALNLFWLCCSWLAGLCFFGVVCAGLFGISVL